MKYIDADRLNADLDKWVEAMADAEGDYSDGVRFAIQHFIFLLASLLHEQPEVDLEKEVVSICKTYGITEHLDAELGPVDIKNIAHHFYELGLNERKEDKQ